MSTAYDVSVARDGMVIVLVLPDSINNKDKIIALLVECGINPAAISFVALADLGECQDLAGVPIILPIGKGTCEAPKLEEAARHCAQEGGRIIVVFDEGFEFTGLHSIAANYGTQCGWSADQLAPRIIGGAEAGPLDASGRPVETSTPRQVRCGA